MSKPIVSEPLGWGDVNTSADSDSVYDRTGQDEPIEDEADPGVFPPGAFAGFLSAAEQGIFCGVKGNPINDEPLAKTSRQLLAGKTIFELFLSDEG